MTEIRQLTRCDDCGRYTDPPQHPCIDLRGVKPRVVPPKSYVSGFVIEASQLRPRRKKLRGGNA